MWLQPDAIDDSTVVSEIGERMSYVVSQSDKMKEMTSVQAERSRTLTEITTLSAEASVQTLKGAGEVVGITEELQNLSTAMSEQINQFKIDILRQTSNVVMRFYPCCLGPVWRTRFNNIRIYRSLYQEIE